MIFYDFEELVSICGFDDDLVLVFTSDAFPKGGARSDNLR